MTSAGAPRPTRCQLRHLNKHPAISSDWHCVGWVTSTDAMSTKAPRHIFMLKDIVGSVQYITPKTQHQFIFVLVISLCEKILTWLLLFIPVKYSHEISSLQPKTKGKGNNMVVQKSRGRIQLATRKACQQNICSKTAIAKCGSTQG